MAGKGTVKVSTRGSVRMSPGGCKGQVRGFQGELPTAVTGRPSTQGLGGEEGRQRQVQMGLQKCTQAPAVEGKGHRV